MVIKIRFPKAGAKNEAGKGIEDEKMKWMENYNLLREFKEDQGTAEYIERMEREWPGGRPEDYEYQ